MLLAPLAALGILTLPRLEQRWTVCHHLARLHARLCGYALRVEGADRLPATGCIVVANHASYIDGLVLAAALPHPLRFVAKAELRDSRLLRPLFERMGTHFVRRFDTSHGIQDADTLAAGAAAGAPLLFFAEGTPEFAVWKESMAAMERQYLRLLETSSAQAARTVLPNSCKTEIIVYANLAEWRHILALRTSRAAEPSMREVMIPLQAELRRRYPTVFA